MKKLDLIVSPSILCLQIKRFNSDGDKIKSTVRVDFLLDLAKYLIKIFYLYIVTCWKIQFFQKMLNTLFLE